MSDCPFCKTRKILIEMLKTIEEEIPVSFGVPLYDDPITDIFNAVDDAISTFRCYCEEEPK
jgi:hypothetical protein